MCSPWGRGFMLPMQKLCMDFQASGFSLANTGYCRNLGSELTDGSSPCLSFWKMITRKLRVISRSFTWVTEAKAAVPSLLPNGTPALPGSSLTHYTSMPAHILQIFRFPDCFIVSHVMISLMSKSPRLSLDVWPFISHRKCFHVYKCHFHDYFWSEQKQHAHLSIMQYIWKEQKNCLLCALCSSPPRS